MSTRNFTGRLTALSLLIAGMMVAAPAMAESVLQTGAGALTASPRLDFRVVVPKFVRFQVGSAAAVIDLVEFTVPGVNVGDGTDIARTNGGAIPVLLQGNAGNISVTGTTLGTLNNGAGTTITYAEILSTSSNAALGVPTLVDAAASAAVVVTPNVGTQVVNRTANWSFAYSNTNLLPASTFGGVNINNGRVTYTASLP
jgi:hypothetical protein